MKGKMGFALLQGKKFLEKKKKKPDPSIYKKKLAQQQKKREIRDSVARA